MAAAGHTAPDCVQGKPLGPNVSTIINSGTVAEGATSVVDAMQKEGKEVITFPSSGVTVTVLRNAQNETREYLSDHVLPGLTSALDSLCGVQPKPTLTCGSLNTSNRMPICQLRRAPLPLQSQSCCNRALSAAAWSRSHTSSTSRPDWQGSLTCVVTQRTTGLLGFISLLVQR